jgi:uncharacterized protein
MTFDWDEAKNAINIEKHGFDFNDAHEIFDSDRLELQDNRKDYGEPRVIALGLFRERVMVVVYTPGSMRGIRIISVRKANNREKERYYQQIKK